MTKSTEQIPPQVLSNGRASAHPITSSTIGVGVDVEVDDGCVGGVEVKVEVEIDVTMVGACSPV